MRLMLVAITVLVALLILLFKYRKKQSIDLSLFMWAVGTSVIGLASIGYFLAAKDPVGLIIASFVFMPLLPLHGLYRTVVSEFPIVEATLFSIIMPLVGLSLLAEVLSMNVPLGIDKDTIEIITALALTGALYGALKALVQTRLTSLVSLAGISLFSILWWFIAESYAELTTTGGESITPQIIIFAISLSLVIAGVLLSWRAIAARYGDIEINKINDAIGGLFDSMPLFAVLFSLIIFAAMGLPPFGLFTGYMEMLIASTTTLGFGMWLILLTLLITSWYFIKLLQKVLFGPTKNNITGSSSTDIKLEEAMPLAVIVSLLLILGLAPYDSLINLINFIR